MRVLLEIEQMLCVHAQSRATLTSLSSASGLITRIQEGAELRA